VNSELFRSLYLEKCRLDPGKGILAAFSGGADSLSLLISLKAAGLAVTAAHFNHHLRSEAGRDEKSASDLAARLDIPFISGGADVPAVVRDQKLSVEEAARHCRYSWLLEQAEALSMQAVAIGHTADDQVETILMHLLRGSGLDGLTGMPYRQIFPLWNKSIPVVRPLLDTWREETEAICREAGLVPVQDASNQSTRYFRNRIRLELVPYLKEYNPQAKQHLWQTARILAEEQALLQTVKENAWDRCFDSKAEHWLALKLSALDSLLESLQKYVLRRGLLELEPGLRDIDFEITGRLTAFLNQSTRSGEMHIFNDLWVNRSNERLVFWKGKPGLAGFYPQIEPGRQYHPGIPGILVFPDWELEIEAALATSGLSIDSLGNIETSVSLDADKLTFPLTVRGMRPGERIAPLGMGGKIQKLSDYFINHKVPRQARANWPLVFSGDIVIWVAGLGISEIAAVTPQTRQVLRICLRQPVHRPDGSV
jgi:tRNA(Ile)-lysidine synthase